MAVIPDRAPSVVGVREALDTMLGGYVPPAWTEDALCWGTDPALFYPELGQPTRPAEKVCARCPVREQCLEDALAEEAGEIPDRPPYLDAHGTPFGVRGGLSANRRRPLVTARRRQRKAAS